MYNCLLNTSHFAPYGIKSGLDLVKSISLIGKLRSQLFNLSVTPNALGDELFFLDLEATNNSFQLASATVVTAPFQGK